MRLLGICSVMVFCLVFTSAWADEQAFTSVLDKRFNFYGGIQIYQADGTFSSVKEGRPEVEVDLDDLGLSETWVSPVAGVVVNLGKRFTLRFDYFGYHDENTETAEFEFEFDDITVPVGARIDSSLDIDVYAMNLAYNFYHSERARFGVGIGVHAANLDLKIKADANVGGEEVSLGQGEADLLVPVPNLYAYGAYAFKENFVLRYGAGWLSANYGDYDGSFLFANAFLEYWPFKYAGIGAGYRYLKADIEYDPGNKIEEYDVELPGPLVYVVFGF